MPDVEQCIEAEDLLRKHDSYNFHMKIRKITGQYRKRNLTAMKNKNEKLIIDQREIVTERRTFTEKLFKAEQRRTFSKIERTEELSGRG